MFSTKSRPSDDMMVLLTSPLVVILVARRLDSRRDVEL